MNMSSATKSFLPAPPVFPSFPEIEVPPPRVPGRRPWRCPDRGPEGLMWGWRLAGSVSVGHGPGVKRNEGTAEDLGTGAPDSNLTEIDPSQEPMGGQQGGQKPRSDDTEGLLPGSRKGPAQPRDVS